MSDAQIFVLLCLSLKEYSVILKISFLWHESEDINQKWLLSQFQLYIYKLCIIMCTGISP